MERYIVGVGQAEILIALTLSPCWNRGIIEIERGGKMGERKYIKKPQYRKFRS
jgi:hypothetical protein